MIIFPWPLRMAADSFFVILPVWYMYKHPTTHFWEYFENKRRLGRRKTFENFKSIDPDAKMSVDEVKKLYEELGIEI